MCGGGRGRGKKGQGRQGKRRVFSGGQEEAKWVEGELLIPPPLFCSQQSLSSGDPPTSLHLVTAGLPIIRSCPSSPCLPWGRSGLKPGNTTLVPRIGALMRDSGEEGASDGHILERWSINSTSEEEVVELGQNPGV